MTFHSALKSGMFGESLKTTMMPMRVHEMDLGLPKSAGQPGKSLRSQPIRVGPLLEAEERSKTKSFARRNTVASASTRNFSRQLYNERADQIPPDACTIGGSHLTNNLINLGSTEKSQPVRLGLSKSDGKLKLNDQRSQPIRVKHLMESWEKSQTAKRAGQKTFTDRLRSVNVRRKLYCAVPSPDTSHKVAKKLFVPHKPQGTNITSQKAERPVKANAVETKNTVPMEKVSRKSFLLPPNYIRDKHISLKAKDAIIEESPTSLFPEEQNTTLPQSLESVKTVVAGSLQQSERVFESNTKTPRPSVIMGLATSTVIKTRSQSDSSESSGESCFVLSHPPQEKINRNSTMPLHRLDAADTSLQDLLENSAHNSQVFSRVSNLPHNSFLRTCENSEQSLAQMDRQTLSWFHGNMKLSIQTMEESLFSMKKMFKTIDDIINSSEPKEKPLKTDTNDNDPEQIPKIIVENTGVMQEELRENDSLSIFCAHEDEIFDEEPQQNHDENFADENKENIVRMNGQEDEKEKEEKGEKTRRRSSRIAAIKAGSIKNTEDTFTKSEKELNMSCHKSKSETPDKSTPAKRKTVDPRSRRSIREYMALKSCAKFLQTPDHKGRLTANNDKTGTPAQRRAAERALSLRVLDQLHNLYDESPE